MWPYFVVVATPHLDDRSRLDAIAKPLRLEALRAKRAVEALVHSVLPWLARLDEGRVDALVVRPAQKRFRDELRPVVAADIARSAALADEAREHVDDAPRANAAGHVDREALARPLVDDREALDLSAVRARVEGKSIAQTSFCPFGGVGRGGDAATRLRRRLRGTCRPAMRHNR